MTTKRKSKLIYRLVLSSPGDVDDECQRMKDIVDELNKGIADERNVHLELIHWKTDAYPGFHAEGPQGIIDPALDIPNSDILIGIFWKRFGTPTKDASSGTEYEFKQAYENWKRNNKPQIMIYFKDAEQNLLKPAEIEQYFKVRKFKEEFPDKGMYDTFTDTNQFERKVRQHLTLYIKQLKINGSPYIPSTTVQDDRLDVIKRYCLKLKQRFSNIHLFGEKRTGSADMQSVFDRMSHIDSGFVPLNLQDWCNDEEETKGSPLKIDNLFFNDHSIRRFLIRGLPGSGKTTLLRYLTYRFASMGVESKKQIIPVYMRCKSFTRNDTIEDFVMEQINADCDSIQDYERLITADYFLENPMVLLFDGLDEIEDEQSSVNLRTGLVNLKKKYPRCTVIVSSRPIKLHKKDFPSFHCLDLLRLNPAMIDDYLKRWFLKKPDKLDALKSVLEQKPRIQALASNPFLLSMICFTFENAGDTALVERRSDLYAKCTQYLLENRHDPSKVNVSKSDYEHALGLLKDISLRFFLWGEQDFSVDHINIIGKRYFTAEAIGTTSEFLDNVQHQTGLIQRAKQGFTFIHRSLWEYFTALALLEEKSPEFIIKHSANPDWEEVVRLYAGLLADNEQVISLVKNLWNINRPLALRVTTEVDMPASELIKPLIEHEEGNQSKLLLIDSLEQSLPLIPTTEQKELLYETLTIMLYECDEKDCEVIYHAEQLLHKQNMSPLESGGIIYQLLDLDHATERQQQLLDDPDNCFELINVKGGIFFMGDDDHSDNEKPPHQVKLDTFFMSKHPVTNRLLSSFPFGEKYPHYGGAHNPAIGNTWFEARYFALWIGARLPTEAEWEYAARGGKKATRHQYYFGDSTDELTNNAWFGDTERQVAHAVDERNSNTGKENLNQLGLANMSGNVWEWCQDWYSVSYYEECHKKGVVTNPQGAKTGSYRVLRGGGWGSSAQYCCSASRDIVDPDYRNGDRGFRLVFVP